MTYEPDPEAFEDAADAIERSGWFQLPETSADTEDDGRLCAFLALEGWINTEFFAHYVDPSYEPDLHDFPRFGRSACAAITWWNDHPDRTEQEVLDTLRAFAKECRK